MGSIGGTGDFERVLTFTRQHPHLAAELISHRIPFADYGAAFELAQNRRQAMKVLITFD
jgi:threonine dehydrogenase-like Zn-dependent dehydrogenase